MGWEELKEWIDKIDLVYKIGALLIALVSGLSFLRKKELWKKYKARYLERKYPYWPKRFEWIDKCLHESKLFNRDDPEKIRQQRDIIEEAEIFIRYFRVALSEDYDLLRFILERKMERIEFCLTKPARLDLVCEKELAFLEERYKEDPPLAADKNQLKKYFKDGRINSARACCDCACALIFIRCFISTLTRRKHITFYYCRKDPSFRGTITEKEIAFVRTKPYAPGMYGELHSVKKAFFEDKQEWKLFNEEIERELKQMDIKEVAIQSAIEEYIHHAIRNIRSRKIKTTCSEVQREKLIKSISGLVSFTEKPYTPAVLETIRNSRNQIINSLEECFQPFYS